MIRTESEYKSAAERLKGDLIFLQAQRQALQSAGFEPHEVERGMQAAVSFQAQLREEVDAYERIVRGDITPIENLTNLGRMLIGLRIASRVSQRELAGRLGVNESAVSRDERNEYHGITLERAQRVLEALGGSICITAEPAGAGAFAAVAGEDTRDLLLQVADPGYWGPTLAFSTGGHSLRHSGREMASSKQIYVERREQGDYAVRREGSDRASATAPTQKEAIAKARALEPGVKPNVERVRNTEGGKRDKWRKA